MDRYQTASPTREPGHVPGTFGALQDRMADLVDRARSISAEAHNIRDALLGGQDAKASPVAPKAVPAGYIESLDYSMNEMAHELTSLNAAIGDLRQRVLTGL